MIGRNFFLSRRKSFHLIPNDDTFHKLLHQVMKQLLVGSLRYVQIILIQFLLSDALTTDFQVKRLIPEQRILVAAMRLAKEHGYIWLCIDCDGPEVDELKPFV